MSVSNRLLVIAGCIILAYAILATALHWEGNKFSATMAATFFIFAMVRWIGSQSANKKIQGNAN